MTFTTVGHKDTINEKGEPEQGRDWEYVVGFVIILFATAIFTYMNANFTSMMLKFYSEVFRPRLEHVASSAPRAPL